MLLTSQEETGDYDRASNVVAALQRCMFLEAMTRFPLVLPRLQRDQRYGVFLSEWYVSSANHGEEHSNARFWELSRVKSSSLHRSTLIRLSRTRTPKTLDRKYGMLYKG
jgi:hypothetical protein